MEWLTDRARGTFAGFVLGDSLGIPTSGMTADEVTDKYGFITGVGDLGDHARHPRAPRDSTSSYTELMLSSARLIGEDSIDAGGEPRDPHPRHTPAFSTARAAAMAVPIGVAYSVAAHGDLLFTTVDDLCSVTNESRQSREAAMIVAAAISAAIDGETVHEAIDIALAQTAGATIGGHRTSEASVVARTLQALDWAADLRSIELVGHLHDVVGLSVSAGEAVPAAMTLARAYSRDPFRGVCAATQLGGESPLIGALAGALLGAARGIQAYPRDVLDRLDPLALDMAVADRLLADSGRCSTIRGATIG